MSQKLKPDLQTAGYGEIIDTLKECKELARLYELPIYSKIPENCTEDAGVFSHPAGIIQHDSHLNKFFLTPININQNLTSTSALLKEWLSSLYSNLDQTIDIYENIRGNLSSAREYVSIAEGALNFLTGLNASLPFIGWLLPFFSDTKSQIDNLLRSVNALNFESLGNDLSHRSLEDIFGDIARSVRALRATTRNKIDTLPENDSAIMLDETAETETWLKMTWNAIGGALAVLGRGLSWFFNAFTSTHSIGENFRWQIIPPEARLNLPDGRLSGSTGGINFVHLLSQTPDATTTGMLEVSVNPTGDNPDLHIRAGVNRIEARRSVDAGAQTNISRDEINIFVNGSILFNASENLTFGADARARVFSTSDRLFTIERVNEGGITSFRENWVNFLKMGFFIKLRLP